MKVIVVEESYIISNGISTLLRELRPIKELVIVKDLGECKNGIKRLEPDLIFVNTLLISYDDVYAMVEQLKVPPQILIYSTRQKIDMDSIASIDIFESKEELLQKINTVVSKIGLESNGENELSDREKSILAEVALGLTNKEISEKLYISTHTVISHRKNITRKLGIKTVSGLTVYAIINGLIEMDDVTEYKTDG